MAREPTWPVWEYRIISETVDVDHLDTLGQAGWEVVGGGDATGKRLLKRPGISFRERVTLEQRRRVYDEHGLPPPDDEDAP